MTDIIDAEFTEVKPSDEFVTIRTGWREGDNWFVDAWRDFWSIIYNVTISHRSLYYLRSPVFDIMNKTFRRNVYARATPTVELQGSAASEQSQLPSDRLLPRQP